MSGYDVTAISEARDYVPIAADVPELETAEQIARDLSSKPVRVRWSAVLVKDNGRGGLIVATYVDGKRQPS